MKEYNEATTQDAVFHTTAETRKICNDKNNARNRCQYTRAVSSNKMNLIEDDAAMERILYETEDEEVEDREEELE